MKKIVVLASLTLAGCATTPTAGNISETAQQIQSYTRLACSFVPTIATIAALLSKGGSSSVATIAQDICSAVTQPVTFGIMSRGAPVVPMVNGVKIKGSFVK